jgi:hypothetical protein
LDDGADVGALESVNTVSPVKTEGKRTARRSVTLAARVCRSQGGDEGDDRSGANGGRVLARPPLDVLSSAAVLTVSPCPTRTMLQIRWPLTRA